MFQILVVEDDASLRKLMSAALKQHGYVTFLANDGLEALDVLFCLYTYNFLLSNAAAFFLGFRHFLLNLKFSHKTCCLCLL